MRIRQNKMSLPSKLEAIDTITGFISLEAKNITDHRKLAEALGGMSVAISAIVLNYSEIGLWTELNEAAGSHKFAVMPQDQILGHTGARLERSAPKARTDLYFRGVSVPTDDLLQQFMEADPTTLQQGYVAGRPGYEDICAVGVTTDRGIQTDIEHWPFHMPTARPDGYPTTSAEDAIGYAQMLQGLSSTLIEVV